MTFFVYRGCVFVRCFVFLLNVFYVRIFRFSERFRAEKKITGDFHTSKSLSNSTLISGRIFMISTNSNKNKTRNQNGRSIFSLWIPFFIYNIHVIIVYSGRCVVVRCVCYFFSRGAFSPSPFRYFWLEILFPGECSPSVQSTSSISGGREQKRANRGAAAAVVFCFLAPLTTKRSCDDIAEGGMTCVCCVHFF